MSGHEDSGSPRFGWLGGFREPVRTAAFDFLRAWLQTDDGRQVLADSVRGLLREGWIPPAAPPPYPEIGAAPRAANVRGASTPVFLTGRFRSGSTLLWNIFRQVPDCTAFYEPLNERRWFDPASRGNRVDSTHLGVEEYWREYEGLDHLGKWYRVDWVDRNLYMPEHHCDEDLHAYIRALVAAAPRRAILQFNRVDFRLPWLRHHFPSARLIHLYRHPRDQWCSSLVDVTKVPRRISVEDFQHLGHDHFYLLSWARDLSHSFPFLDPRRADHPYDLFYGIWRLSYLFGRHFSHASFCFETLCASPRAELERLMVACEIGVYDIDRLAQVVVPQKSKWQQYADQDWFAEREMAVDAVMDRFLDTGARG